MRQVLINKYIVADPRICHGKPTFRGTRVMVWQVLEMLSEGVSERNIQKAFPAITSRHIASALDYASSITRENYVIINPNPARPSKVPA